jgi:hypothetical protein
LVACQDARDKWQENQGRCVRGEPVSTSRLDSSESDGAVTAAQRHGTVGEQSDWYWSADTSWDQVLNAVEPPPLPFAAFLNRLPEAQEWFDEHGFPKIEPSVRVNNVVGVDFAASTVCVDLSVSLDWYDILDRRHYERQRESPDNYYANEYYFKPQFEFANLASAGVQSGVGSSSHALFEKRYQLGPKHAFMHLKIKWQGVVMLKQDLSLNEYPIDKHTLVLEMQSLPLSKQRVGKVSGHAPFVQ